MEETWAKHFLSVAFPWGFGLVTFVWVLRSNRKSRNPLEWSRVDRCLLLIVLFCFVGGASNLMTGIAASFYFERLAWINWAWAQTYYQINRIIGIPWIPLLLLGLWLRRRSPENRGFAHVVMQYNAVHVALICYAFGPVTHPGPFLLGMALGTLNFLLFEKKIALPWLVTFTVLTVGLSAATWAGLIPYAPIFTSSPFTAGKIESYYFVGTMAFTMVMFLLMILLAAYIFGRWRDREKKVAERPLKIYEVGGIAGRFNLALEEKEPALVVLARHIPLRFTVLEGKHIGKKGVACFMTRLSRKCSEITLDEPVELLKNLQMNLMEVDQELENKAFYGKVMGHSEENAHSHVVRFTSVPAEVRSYFQAHRQYGKKAPMN